MLLLTSWIFDNDEIGRKRVSVCLALDRTVITHYLANAQQSPSPSKSAEGVGRDLLYPRDAVEAQAVLQDRRRAIDKDGWWLAVEGRTCAAAPSRDATEEQLAAERKAERTAVSVRVR